MDEKEDFFIKETQEHVNNVKKFIDIIIIRLKSRAAIHDHTKFKDPEKKLFAEITPKLKNTTYNSPEYKSFLKQLGQALDHHYMENPHHPQYFEYGIEGMNLIDIIELFCDWKASTLRHADGSLHKSIDVNTKRFKLSPQLVNIFRNSVELFESINEEIISGINISEPIIDINHKDLERHGNSPYKSVCPKCEQGILLIYRNENFILQEYDRCVLCGQQFRYKDIQELRKTERNEHGKNSKEI